MAGNVTAAAFAGIKMHKWRNPLAVVIPSFGTARSARGVAVSTFIGGT